MRTYLSSVYIHQYLPFSKQVDNLVNHFEGMSKNSLRLSKTYREHADDCIVCPRCKEWTSPFDGCCVSDDDLIREVCEEIVLAHTPHALAEAS